MIADAPGHVAPDHVVLVGLDPLADHVVGHRGQDERLIDRDQDQEDREGRQGVAPAEGGGPEAPASAVRRSRSWSRRPPGGRVGDEFGAAGPGVPGRL